MFCNKSVQCVADTNDPEDYDRAIQALRKPGVIGVRIVDSKDGKVVFNPEDGFFQDHDHRKIIQTR